MEDSKKTVQNCPRWYSGRREVSKHVSAIGADFAVSPSLFLGVNIEHKVCSEKMVICPFFGGVGWGGEVLLKLEIV